MAHQFDSKEVALAHVVTSNATGVIEEGDARLFGIARAVVCHESG